MGELVDRVVRKNINNESTLPLTISAQYGLVDQITYFNNRVASRDVSNYYLVLNGEFAYNKSTSDGYPFGAVKRLDLYEKGVLSTLYIVFAPKKEQQIDSDYLTVFFDTDRWHKGVAERAAEGARNHGLLNISAEDFFDIDLSVPKDIVEQKQIGAFIRQLDNLITLHQRQPFLQSPPDISLIVQLTPPFYTFSWEQRKLGDMMNVTSVKRIHQSDWTDSGVRFLRARDIVAAAKNEEPDDYLYISKEKYEEYSALSGKVGVSDLLVTGVGTIGVPYLVRNLEPLYFKDGNIIWFQNSDKIDGKFLFYSFSAEQIQGFINESAGIGTVGTYTIESGKKTPISLPNQIEQAKVGEFFQQLDNLITLHQRKFEKLTNVKKSMLEKMFPQNGSSYPEIRFKGFTDPWEQRKLGEMVDVCSGMDYKHLSEGDIPVYGTGGYMLSVNKALSYDRNAVGIGRKGTIDKPYILKAPFWTVDTLFYAIPKDSKNIDFTFDVFQKVDWKKKDESTGVPSLSKIAINETSISTPSKLEQERIGSFFRNLDTLITLHQREHIKPILEVKRVK